MRRPPLVIALATIFLFPGAAGMCQEAEARPTTRSSDTLKLQADVWHAEEANKALYLLGGVRLRYGDLDIRCDNAIVWLVKESLRPSIAGDAAPDSRQLGVGFDQKLKEVYVEGNVLLRQGEEVHNCEAAFFDLVHKRGIIVDARTRFPLTMRTGEKGTLSVQADELRVLSEFQMQAVGARISTCPFGNPHYHVASETVDLFRARARQQRAREPGTQPPSFYYTASGNALFLGSSSSFPVLWVPDIAGDSTTPQGETLRYVKDVRFGHSSEFGWEPGITLGDDLVDSKGEKWGAWLLDLDWLSLRGPGAGVDFVYDKPGFFKGHIKANYQRDRGEDELFGEPPTKNRGRFSIRHRTWLPYDVQLDFETNVFSDRGYFPTYFEDEFKQDKPPETYAYLKRAFQNSAITGLYSTRVNDWETVDEFQPRLEYLLVTERLLDVFCNPLYLTARGELSRPKRVFDDDLHLPAISNVRADVDTLVEYPFLAGPVKITPFAGLRTTWYEHDLARDDRTRTGFTYGAEVSTILSRTYDVCGGIFDLDGLRHIIEPSIEYRRTTGVDVHAEDLFFYDQVDAFDDVEAIEFRIRNLFQTVRHQKGLAARVDEVFDLELSTIYFPNADRDNDGDAWSNLIGDAALRFSDELQFLVDFEVNLNRRHLEEFNIAAGYVPSRELQVYAGFRHFEDDYDVVYLQANWRASEKWLIRAYTSYDVGRGQGVEHDLGINRIGHDWVFSMTLGADIGENDYSFSIGLEPRILFDPILRPGGRRREPEFQYLGSWVNR